MTNCIQKRWWTKDIERWLASVSRRYFVVTWTRRTVGERKSTQKPRNHPGGTVARVIARKSRGWWDFSLSYVRAKESAGRLDEFARASCVCIGRENTEGGWGRERELGGKRLTRCPRICFFFLWERLGQSKRSDRREILASTRLGCEMRFPSTGKDNLAAKEKEIFCICVYACVCVCLCFCSAAVCVRVAWFLAGKSSTVNYYTRANYFVLRLREF